MYQNQLHVPEPVLDCLTHIALGRPFGYMIRLVKAVFFLKNRLNFFIMVFARWVVAAVE